MHPDARKTVRHIVDKYDLTISKEMPVIIPNVGRKNLAYLFEELDFRKGVEVGVERGRYSQTLCRANPQAEIWGVDPWKAYRSYRDHVTQSKLDEFYEITKERMSHYPLYTPVRKFSVDAAKDFKDGELDFVYIDGNHTLPWVMDDLLAWSKKVRFGGIVSGHDYRKSVRLKTQNHVVYVVHCFVQSYRIKPWFLLGRKEKTPGEVRDKNRSFMWVKMR